MSEALAQSWLPPGRKVADLVNPSVPVDPRVIEYLKTAPVVVATGRQAWTCELGCPPGQDAYVLRSDNEYLWPNALVHYIERHGVRLPEAMIEHMASRGFVPPEPRELDYSRMPVAFRPPGF